MRLTSALNKDATTADIPHLRGRRPNGGRQLPPMSFDLTGAQRLWPRIHPIASLVLRLGSLLVGARDRECEVRYFETY